MKVYTSVVTARRSLSSSAFELRLARPAGFTFRPGQHLRLLLQERQRDYTMTSGPEDPELAILVRQVPGGWGSSRLAAQEPGGTLRFTGPHGRFLFRPSPRKPLFVCTGTGIAPFVAMARSGVRGYTVLHGARDPEDLYYRDILVAGADGFVGCISGAGKLEEAGLFSGRVTGFIKERLPQGAYDFYLCGREEMVRDVIFLVDERFPGSRVFTEVFF